MDGFPLKVFMAMNTFAIRVSRGRIGSQLGTQTILLLHTTGRHSGRKFVTPVAYFFVDGIYFLIGSNWGKPRQAAWYYNLLENPLTNIEVRGKTIQVETRVAQGAEYDRLWLYAVEHHPPYLHYKEMTTRHIPIVVMEPLS
jgi:deazaflavin-dependent oxidoreductase (nitroreductase family)